MPETEKMSREPEQMDITDYVLRAMTEEECINWALHGLPLTPPSDDLPPPLYAEWIMDRVPMEAPWMLPDTDLPLPMCTLVADPEKYRAFVALRYNLSLLDLATAAPPSPERHFRERRRIGFQIKNVSDLHNLELELGSGELDAAK